tara:strand:- start:1647 stop:1829 length:183 start_codon:yes stop_codon:yes gene_type:complete
MKKFILILCLFTITTNISAQSSTVTFEGKADMSSSIAEVSYVVGKIKFNQSVLATFEIEN